MKVRASRGSVPFSLNKKTKTKYQYNSTRSVVTQEYSQDLGSLGERGHQYGIITLVFFLHSFCRWRVKSAGSVGSRTPFEGRSMWVHTFSKLPNKLL